MAESNESKNNKTPTIKLIMKTKFNTYFSEDYHSEFKNMKIPRDPMNVKWSLQLKNKFNDKANLYLLMKSCWECNIEVLIVLSDGESMNATCSTGNPHLIKQCSGQYRDGWYEYVDDIYLVYVSHSDINRNMYLDIPLLNLESFSDIQIKLDNDDIIFAHKYILSSRNIVFEAMLKNNSFIEAQENVIKIVDFSADVIKELIHFIYTGTAPKANGIAKDLFFAAEKYQISDLKKLCEIEIISSINEENAYDTIKFAVTFDATFVYQRAICFMAHNHGP